MLRRFATFAKDHDASRPADVYISQFEGRETCLDVSVVHPCTPSTVVHAAQERGYAASSMEASKLALYSERCAANNLLFLPIVLESYGGFGPSAVISLCRLARLRAQFTGEEYSSCKKWLFQSMAIASQRAIALSLQDRSDRLQDLMVR
jgi:hypothetical protein